MRKIPLIALSLIVMLFLLACQASRSQIAGPACDRACLKDMTELFLEAKSNGSLKHLNLSDDLRATSNSQVMPLGQGETWKPGISFINRFTFVDTKTQTVIFFGTIAGKPSDVISEPRPWWHYVVRLTLDETGRISEVEEHSNTAGFKRPENVEVPFKEASFFNVVLPENERVSADELVAAADSYWAALTTGEGGNVPFGPDCQRTEFGSYSTNSPLTHDRTGRSDFVPQPQVGRSCRKFFENPRFRWPTDNRRYYIVDEARGVVVGIGQLNKFGDEGIPGLTLTEAFKIVDGRIEFLWAPAFAWGIEDSGWPDWKRPTTLNVKQD